MTRAALLRSTRIAIATSLVFVAVLKIRSGEPPQPSLPTWIHWSSVAIESAVAIGLLTSRFAWAARLLIAFALVALLRWFMTSAEAASRCGCLGGMERMDPRLPAIVAACWGLGSLAILWLREQGAPTSPNEQASAGLPT